MGLFNWLNPLQYLILWGGGSGGGKSVTQNYSPEEAKRRTKVMDEAEQIYNRTSGQIASSPFPGAQVVPFSPETLAAQQWGTDFATQSMPGINQGLADAMGYGLNGAMDVQNNSYLGSAIDAAVRPITNDYLDPNGVYGQLRRDEIQNGGYGTSSRDALARGVAGGRYAQTVGDTAARMSSDAYISGQDTFARTLGLAPGIVQTMQTPLNLLSGVGAQRENLKQMEEDYAANARMWDLNAEWTPLQNWANIVFGTGPNSSSTSTSGPGRNPIGGAVGGAMSGFALGSQIGSVGGPMGAVGGAILGALFS